MHSPKKNRWAAALLAIGATVLLTSSFGNRSQADQTLPDQFTNADLKQHGFVPLSPGKPLDAWDVQPWHQGHWIERDGIIDYDGKAKHKNFQKNSLWTKANYRDFILYVEWRLPSKPIPKPHPIVLFNGDFLLDKNGKRITRPQLDAGDSGILLRGTLKCQANIWSQELGSGEINGYRTDRKMPPEVRRACIPIKQADRPFGEWNTFLITLENDRMTVVLNNEKVIDAVGLPDLPESGPIGLQHHGDRVQFQNLWLKEMK
ncbi:MAG: DUF1080 domain-containing protein [Planctomycetes bacterium]|nr:DUF1080 domain-containing protein [Planctomycetota bacterium]